MPPRYKIKPGVHDQTTVLYSGERYFLLWLGKTRYGRKAKLAPLDNRLREFWVLEDQISDPQEWIDPKGDDPSTATKKQISLIEYRLARLEAVRRFDSADGNGESKADQIRSRIHKKGGTKVLSKSEASQLLDELFFYIDDEM